MSTTAKTFIVSGAIALLWLLVPSLGFADKTCTLRGSDLLRFGYYRETGEIHLITKNGISHMICEVKKDGNRCRDILAMLMGAHLGENKSLLLRYAENNYNCKKPWGGLSTRPMVRYIFFNKY